MDLPNLPPELAVESEPFGIEDLDAVLEEALMSGPDGTDITPERLLRDPDLDAETVPALMRAPARWRVTDDRTAEWAARHWRDASDGISEVTEQAAFWIEQIKGWAEGRARTLENRVRFMAAQLEDYALEQRETSGGKRKTVTLPSATVRTRPQPERVEVIDGKAQEFVAWAEEHLPEVVRVRKDPAASEFGEHLRIGRKLDGVAYHAGLTCGHEAEGTLEPDDPLGAGEMWEHTVECVECPPDPLDGPPRRAITTLERTPLYRPVVLATIPDPEWLPSSPGEENPHGTAAGPAPVEVEVPGVAVRSESVTAKVGR